MYNYGTQNLFSFSSMTEFLTTQKHSLLTEIPTTKNEKKINNSLKFLILIVFISITMATGFTLLKIINVKYNVSALYWPKKKKNDTVQRKIKLTKLINITRVQVLLIKHFEKLMN